MALTQMQIIQSLGEAMSWLERELDWGVPATELRHLTGRIGELYAALITNGQMANETNQKGYDVVSKEGERISVKTTAMQSSSGHISFNPRTLDQVDRIIILRINITENEVETLLNVKTHEAKQLMSDENSSGKCSIALSKLLTEGKERIDIASVHEVAYKDLIVRELENGTIEVEKAGNIVTAKPELRRIAADLGISILNSNGNPYNTRQLGSIIVRALVSAQDKNVD